MQKGHATPKLLVKGGFAGILVLAIVAFFVIMTAVYFLGIKKIESPTSSVSPSPSVVDETESWKTYTNTKVGFELKYPQRYSQPGLPAGAANSPSVKTTGSEDNTAIIFGQTSTDSVDLVVFPFTGTLDELKTYTKSPVILPSYEDTTLIKDVQVGGVTAQWYKATPKIVYPDDPNNGAIRVYFVGKNHGFILNTTLGHNEKEIDQILSTFRFE